MMVDDSKIDTTALRQLSRDQYEALVKKIADRAWQQWQAQLRQESERRRKAAQ